MANLSLSVIAHIPKDTYRNEIEEFFSEVGPVKKCHLVRDKNYECTGIAYIVYTKPEDAEKAAENLNNAKFKGTTVRVKLSRVKKNKGEKRELKDNETDKKQKRLNKKARKRQVKKTRKGRIVIRNLSFKATEEIVEEHFSKYGTIKEVSILRKNDGRMVGCAFVQYGTKLEALKAIQGCNMKPLLGRPIAVDLAIEKEKFALNSVKTENGQDTIEVIDLKEEDGDVENDNKDMITKVKVEDDDKEMITKIKEEETSDDEVPSRMKLKNEEADHEDEEWDNTKVKKEEADSEEEEYSDSGVDDGYKNESEEDDEDEKPPVKHPKISGPSRDVTEGRTLFIKNLSFDATEEEISQILRRFGELKYVLLCMDRLTEHPRGTAFAQYKDRAAADACLDAESDSVTKDQFILHDRPMHIMRAVSRTDLNNKKTEEEQRKSKSDKRNLYLAREGFVRPGTEAAKGVSKADMALRTGREHIKRGMLRNLHSFVSKVRLCVNNIPLNVTDQRLRKIFLEHAPKGARVTEARIMRNLKELDDNCEAISRGYGFVTFTEHEHALTALRRINNNPSIFTPERRPVVEFSMENRAVLNARQKRMEKSREKNPLWKGRPQGDATGYEGKTPNVKTRQPNQEQSEEEVTPSYMGAKANANNRSLTKNLEAKERHRNKGKISRKHFRKEKQDRKHGRKRKEQLDNDTHDMPEAKKARKNDKPSKKRNRKMNKEKQERIKDSKEFNMMVHSYKKKMASANAVANAKRWYED